VINGTDTGPMTTNSRSAAAGSMSASALAWLGHPGTVLAAAVLAVNDHLLKQAFPGLVTGKLSDLAGLVVAPPLLALMAALTGRVRSRRAADLLAAASVLATGAGFTLVKSTHSGADLASRAWSLVAGDSRILADPTDLFALPALVLTWWLWTRARGRPVAGRIVRLVRVLVVVPLAVASVAATSQVQAPLVRSVAAWKGEIIMYRDSATLATPDGGTTWRRLTSAQAAELHGPNTPQIRTRACVPDDPGHCYRVGHGGPRVEETTDGGRNWSVAWQLSTGRQAFLRRVYQGSGSYVGFAPTSVAVADRPAGDYTVLVADGRDGLLLRDTDGRWERRGFDFGLGSSATDSAAVPLTGLGQHIFGECVMAAVAGWLCLLLGFTVTARGDRRYDRWAGAAIRAAAAVVWPLLVLAIFSPDAILGFFGRVLVLTTLPVLLLGLSTGWGTPAMALRDRALLAAVALLTAALTVLPFLGWTVARPDSYAAAAWLAASGFAAGLALSAWAGRSIGRR
jgi:hypothetical protein